MDSEHHKLFCMGAAQDRLPWGPAIVCRVSLEGGIKMYDPSIP